LYLPLKRGLIGHESIGKFRSLVNRASVDDAFASDGDQAGRDRFGAGTVYKIFAADDEVDIFLALW